MSLRLGPLAVVAVVVLVLLVVLGALRVLPGAGPSQLGSTAGPDHTSTLTATAIPEPTPSAALYGDAPADLRELCVRFVVGALAYDSTTEKREAFLDRVRPAIAPGELLRLRGSERAHLAWDMLRARGESVTLEVTGTSTSTPGTTAASTGLPRKPAAAASTTVIVEAERSTTTDLAVVREFIEITLELRETASGWRVTSAHGGGL
ncbi:hypothetical protein ACVW00_003561 [Marmoricola sp. URHA0025 HA25]